MSNNQTAQALKIVLADSYALYLKTQNYHWNVTGANFASLHILFEQQYNELALAVDEIAELIRGLGEKAPASFEEFQALSTIKSGDINAPAEQMVKQLAADQSVIAGIVQNALDIAQEAGDEVVIGALTDRLTVHRKNAWMLRSSL